jgi:allophanate hydrolase subunit 2
VLLGGDGVGARLASPLQQAPCQRDLLRVTAGPQSDWFSDDFYRASYQVTEESNRMGLRLRGPKLGHSREMLTEGVSVGAIQVPPGGQPIILFVEHPTTGGYPKIANVISADHHVLGQLRPRDEVRFERVSLKQALDLLREQEEMIHSVA